MACEIGVNALGHPGDVNRAAVPNERVRLDGRFFRLGDEKFWVKGVTYGPFEPRDDGACLPPTDRLKADLAQIASLGANTAGVSASAVASFTRSR